MDILFIALLVAAGGGALALVLRRKPAPPPPPRRAAAAGSAPPSPGGVRGAVPGRPVAATLPGATPADPMAPAAPPAPLPAALQGLQLVTADTLPADRQQRIADTFRDVPRPPRLLTQLVSLDLMSAASSHELMALVSGEPLIAAKVLGAVNSPAYGLARPVGSVGQAVTFLGLNGVRAICMQYALMQVFRADGPERARRLAATWCASAVAAELMQAPMQRLGLPDPGGLSSAVVLHFLGTVAVTVAVPQALLTELPPRDALARLQAEQVQLGLGAAEIGRLLMQRWDLPPGIVAEAADIALGLVTPWAPGGSPPAEAAAVRRAHAQLSVVLGERLAWGELASLADFDLAADTSAELACARSFLAVPGFAALVAQLKAPALAARVAGLGQAMAVPPAPAAATPRAVAPA